MSQPKLKMFGNLSIDGIKKAMKVSNKVNNYKGEQQLKVSAAQWDDNGISMEVWDPVNNNSIRVGNLRVSNLNSIANNKKEEEDLPF